jgi:hypothetical protein
MKGLVLTFTETLHIKERLWQLAADGPEGRLYALLDGARAKNVHPIIRASRLPSRCLYDGQVAPRLLAAAPHLVQLEREHVFDMDVIAHGWGESWGLFLKSPLDLDGTRKHLRRFLKAKTEDGKVLLFRYYDPRVLRVYLPTCTAEELRTFFGPITAMYLESRTGAEIVEHRLEAGRLSSRTAPLEIRQAPIRFARAAG